MQGNKNFVPDDVIIFRNIDETDINNIVPYTVFSVMSCFDPNGFFENVTCFTNKS